MTTGIGGSGGFVKEHPLPVEGKRENLECVRETINAVFKGLTALNEDQACQKFADAASDIQVALMQNKKGLTAEEKREVQHIVGRIRCGIRAKIVSPYYEKNSAAVQATLYNQFGISDQPPPEN